MLMVDNALRAAEYHRSIAERLSMQALALHGQVSGPIVDRRSVLEEQMWLHVAAANKALRKAAAAERFYAQIA